MILTTSDIICGKEISEYRGVVFGEAVLGINFAKDFAAGLTNFFGGRSGSYEGELISGRDEVLSEMIERAEELGANAIVSIRFDFESLGQGGMLMINCYGTAVKCQ